MLRNDTFAGDARAPRPSLRSLLSGAVVTLALALPACDESPDDAPPAAPAGAVELPEATADDIAAALAERRIAALSVGSSGRIDIVDIAATGAPDYAYVSVGGQSPIDVLQQLVDDQRATPAEVFLALDDGELPEALLADHRARAADDPELAPEPRRLSFTLSRDFDTDINGCPGSFASWLGSWESRFEGTYFTDSYKYSWRNTSNGTTGYYINADSDGRVMSACNSNTNEVQVAFWSQTWLPGPTYPYTLLWSNELGTNEAAHWFSTGGAPMMTMVVAHPSPAPDTYVAYGRCGGGCWN